MPHVELNSVSMEPGLAAWLVVGTLALAGLVLVGMAVRYALHSRRTLAGAHRTAAHPLPVTGGARSTIVCAGLGAALLCVAATMAAGILA